MKRNIDDFDGMKDFILSVITVVAWFLIVTIVIVGYFTVETKGESIMISLISMFFTIISALGIVVTITVYCLQKNSKNKEINRIKIALIDDLSQLFYAIEKILDFPANDDAIILKNENGISIHNDRSGIGFSINKFNNIDQLDIYKVKLMNHDRLASMAISRIKKFLMEYNLSIDKLINNASIPGGYYHEKSPLINLFSGRHNLETIKMWISTIK
ncbi:hypothetical protein RNA47_002531 [Morganella morganii]|nr:hypothetical protein [Morganella morganii]